MAKAGAMQRLQPTDAGMRIIVDESGCRVAKAFTLHRPALEVKRLLQLLGDVALAGGHLMQTQGCEGAPATS